MIIPDELYDGLKWIAQIFLPALATLYYALSTIWGLPYAEQVVGTIVAIDTFLGILLGLWSSNYQKLNPTDGVLEIDTCGGVKDIYRINLTTGFEDLKAKKEIKLKVNPKAYISQEEHRL